jgi:hypothetical protein
MHMGVPPTNVAMLVDRSRPEKGQLVKNRDYTHNPGAQAVLRDAPPDKILAGLNPVVALGWQHAIPRR